MSTAPDGRNETLNELFGSLYELAGEFAGRIGRDEVEARLGRVLRQAGRVDVDQDAWNEIIERYAPLVYAICRRYQLSDRDIEDVGRQVWELLAEQIGRLRQPAALPGWLATTTVRECLRTRRRTQPSGPPAGRPEDQAGFADDVDDANEAAVGAEILAAERDAALRSAMAELPRRCQQLLAMLIHDPPYSYTEISAKLGIPVGSIGPQRTRCLDQLRQAMAAPVSDDRPRPKPRPAP
jgi:RNA polymerase sigma factor (sigma-70 family)